MNQEKKKCLIKSNKDIKQLLFDRITEMGLTYSEVIKDARETHGINMTLSMLSRYFNFEDGQVSYQLTQEHIIWLCDRYNIAIKIMVRKIPYNHKSAQQRLKRKYQ